MPAVKKTQKNGSATRSRKPAPTALERASGKPTGKKSRDASRIGAGKPGPGRPKGKPNLLTRELRERAAEHGPEALNVLRDLMRDGDQPGVVRVAAARELLDRGYGKPVQMVEAEVDVSHAVMNTKELDEIYARAMEKAEEQRLAMVERRKRLEIEFATERGAVSS